MGGECSDPFPSIDNVACLSDTEYLWIDPAVDNQQNTSYYIKLKQNFNVSAFKTVEGIKKALESIDHSRYIINVISSARFELQFYSYLSDHPKISKIILFTWNREKSAQIIQLCPRIDGSCFYEQDFIAKMKEIDFESKHHLSLFNESKIQQINKWALNWRSESQDIDDRKKGKEEFVQFALKFVPREQLKDIKQYQNNYDLNKIESSKEKMVIKWLFEKINCFFFTLTSSMLETSFNNEKIKLVRQPIFDIYNAIKSKYNCTLSEKCVVYANKRLNQRQICQLRNYKKDKSSYLSFFSFLNCSSQKLEQKENYYLFVITLDKKEKQMSQNNGFIFSQDSRAIINIDNYFEILSVSIEMKTVQLRLVSIPSRKELERSDSRWALQLHNRYIKYLLEQYPSQIIGKIFSNQLKSYQRQFEQKQNSSENRNIEYDICDKKLKFIRAKLAFRLQNFQDIQKQLNLIEAEVKKIKKNEAYYNLMGQIYCFYAEIYICLNKLDAFGIKIVEFTDISQKIKSCNKIQITEGQYLLKIQAYILYSQINKLNCEQNKVKLAKLKEKVQKRYPKYVNVSQIAWILRMATIKIEQTLGLYNLALNSAKQLYEIVSLCDGRKERKKQYEYIIIQITKKMDYEAEQKEIQKKKRKVTTNSSLSQLFFKDKPLILDLSELDI